MIERPERAENIPEPLQEPERQPINTSDLAAVRAESTPDHVDERVGRDRPAAAESTEPAPEIDSEPQALFPVDDVEKFRTKWSSIQTGFVDEPRRAVDQGDQLVAEVVQRLSESFATERSSLEQQWDRGDDVSTEDLRVALQRYRAFFERLLAA